MPAASSSVRIDAEPVLDRDDEPEERERVEARGERLVRRRRLALELQLVARDAQIARPTLPPASRDAASDRAGEGRHGHHRSRTSSAEKPGPIAARSPTSPGRASLASRKSPSTNSTEADERFPTSRSERQERSSAAGGSPSARPERLDHLRPAGVGDPVADVPAREPVLGEEGVHVAADARLDHLRHLRGEDHLEAGVDDVPAHHPLGVRVEDGAGRDDARRRRAVRARRRPRGRPRRRRRRRARSRRGSRPRRRRAGA